MKYRDLLKLLHEDGWQHIRTTGSHLHHKHPTKPGDLPHVPWARFQLI